MSDQVVELVGMRTNLSINQRFHPSPFQLPARRRIPRGLLRLRALRLRLAASTRPRFQQSEFQFVK